MGEARPLQNHAIHEILASEYDVLRPPPESFVSTPLSIRFFNVAESSILGTFLELCPFGGCQLAFEGIQQPIVTVHLFSMNVLRRHTASG